MAGMFVPSFQVHVVGLGKRSWVCWRVCKNLHPNPILRKFPFEVQGDRFLRLFAVAVPPKVSNFLHLSLAEGEVSTRK